MRKSSAIRPHEGEAAVSVEIRIRSINEGDLDAVMAIAANLPDAPRWDRRAYQAAVVRAEAKQGVALVAEEAVSGPAGFAIGGIVPPEAEIESIAVRPDLQRRGIARRLFAAFAAEAQRLGCSSTLLEVRPSNAAACRFYESLGFRETARRPAYYADPVEDAILMSRTLK
jgi:[ribosomal protein S18]-alanine N-acetyltransferase